MHKAVVNHGSVTFIILYTRNVALLGAQTVLRDEAYFYGLLIAGRDLYIILQLQAIHPCLLVQVGQHLQQKKGREVPHACMDAMLLKMFHVHTQK